MLESVDKLFKDYEQHCAERGELGAKLCDAVKSVIPPALAEIADALGARGKPACVEPIEPFECATLFTVRAAEGGAPVMALKFEATQAPPSAQMSGYALIGGRRSEIAVRLELENLTQDGVIALVVEQYRAVLFG